MLATFGGVISAFTPLGFPANGGLPSVEIVRTYAVPLVDTTWPARAGSTCTSPASPKEFAVSSCPQSFPAIETCTSLSAAGKYNAGQASVCVLHLACDCEMPAI